MNAEKIFHKCKKKLNIFYSAYADLETPFLVYNYAEKIKPYTKWVYTVLTFFLALNLLSSILKLFSGHISLAIISSITTLSLFVVLRMWCEYMMNVPHSFYEKKTKHK